ncbi:MAG: serine hydrolase [Bryobacteraceae bacterium]
MKRFILFLLLACSCLGGDDTAARKQDMLWQKLARNIEGLDSQLDGVMGVAIVDLTDHRQWAYHADDVFPTASTIKLAILADLYRQGELSLEGKPARARLSDRYTVRREDLVADSAVLGNMTPGVTILTNRDLAGAVVAVSDNSASNILASRLGIDDVNALLDSLGLKKTRLRRQMMDLAAAKQGRENVATPAELVSLLRAIYDNQIFRPALTKDFFTLLATPKDSWIPRLIPEGVKIANKPGSLAGVRCDAGIVFVPNRPFAIAIMTTYDRDEHASEETISRVAQLAWRMFDVMSVSSSYGRQITERNSH